MSIEIAVLIGGERPIYWHLPPSPNVSYIEDSSDLWNNIWTNRSRLDGIAHSHPGSGLPGPSWTDITTFAAIEAGLGKRLVWWITSSDQTIAMSWSGPGKHDYTRATFEDTPEWVLQLRAFSKDTSTE